MSTIHFKDVGRDKKSWEKVFTTSFSETDIAREAKRNGGLASRDVDAELNDDGMSGLIVVGGFRVVGAFTISNA